MSNVYLIEKSGGSYEDAYNYIVKAFLSKESADLELFTLNHDLQLRKETYEANQRKYFEMDCDELDCTKCEFYDHVEEYCGYEDDERLDEQRPYVMITMEITD